MNECGKPFHHRFSATIIKLSLDLYGHAVIGCRKIVRVLEVFSKQIKIPVPHHTTIRQWVIRYGCHQLQAPLEKADDWIVIADLTVSVGKIKCLVILGIRKRDLKENLTLSHKDVTVLGVHPTTKSTGEFANKVFEDVLKRIGTILAIIIDQGSDLKKGARLFKENHSDVTILHDISHKLSNIVEKELKNDVMWFEYIKELNLCKKRLCLTEFAALMPKKQREKARFMDIGHLVYWPEIVRQSRESGHLKDISEERYQDYLGWTARFTESLREWGYMEGIVDAIKGSIREHGISIEIYQCLKIFFEEANIEGDRLQTFIIKALNTVWEEVEKLGQKEALICSTEVLESVFGKYKAINEAIHGVTSNILGILTFVGEEKSEKSVIEAMEGCSVKEAVNIVKKMFGETVCSLRRKFFPIKRTKFDIDEKAAYAA